MRDCIERDKAFNAVLKLIPKVDDDGYCWVIRGDAAMAIDSIPAADVREVKRGNWIEENHTWANALRCSECGRKIFCGTTNFCPYCGADMRDVDDAR